MDRSDNPLDMNDMKEIWENGSSATPGNPGSGNPPFGSSSPWTATSMGGKDHTANPAGTPKARILVEDGFTVLPGSSTEMIRDELRQLLVAWHPDRHPEGLDPNEVCGQLNRLRDEVLA